MQLLPIDHVRVNHTRQCLLDRPGKPQVAVVLGRWYNAALHDRWSTTAAVPGNYTTYKLEKETGYLMAAADAAKASIELEDCVGKMPGHPDHILDYVGICESAGYQRLRTAGWVYSYPLDRTVPLYRCYSAQDQSHFASNEADCEKLGTMERLLGYSHQQATPLRAAGEPHGISLGVNLGCPGANLA